MERMFLVRPYPCPAPNLQSRPSLHAACRRGRPPPAAPPTRTPRPAPHALLLTLGRARGRSTSR
eukprot:scaffold10366_cov59-Phaeocystis_antarctica.AAC.1